MKFNLPPTAENTEKYIKTILQSHPCSKSFFCGRSVLGRKIRVLTIGKTAGAVLFAGATHGSEWLTALVLLRFFEELCEAFEHEENICGINAKKAISKRGLAVIPVLNPDGVEINLRGKPGALSAGAKAERLSAGDYEHWNANANGVDINHNFGAGWELLHEQERKNGIFGPAPRQYGGPRAFSEPETRAVCGFCSTFDVKRLYSFHSQGEEIYWQYGDRTPPHARMVARMMGAMSGYTPAIPSVTASHGGFKDWFIEKTGRMGLTVELGRGKNPLPMSDLDPVYEKARDMLLFAAFL